MSASDGGAAAQASGGEHLSSAEVSSLPLNARDFSKLLLLAAGTMTDTNGAANFTQQFAVNGQRGVGNRICDRRIRHDRSGDGRGDVFQLQRRCDSGSAVQFRRDARGDRPRRCELHQRDDEVGSRIRSTAACSNLCAMPRSTPAIISTIPAIRLAARIPPFARNEFGFTNGGPVVLPGIYDGRDRTFYFGEYQGFRQVLGTTQVIPVPTVAERQGIDTHNLSR